jgi:hypothetical protein
MLFTILGALTGLAGPISQAVAKLADLNIAKVQAGSDKEKQEIDGQISEAHDRMMVLTAEAGSRVNSIVRGLLAFGPMLYLDKVFIWDKVIGSFAGYTKDIFTTDGLSDELKTIVMVVLSFYFAYDIAASWRKK